MAEPIIQKIAAELLTRLQNITRANGFEFDSSGVIFDTRDTNTWQPEERQIHVDQQEEVENEDLSCPGNPPAKAYNVVFQINGYANKLDVDTTEQMVTESGVSDNQMSAAIQKAITNNDAAHWHEFDGNSINATIGAGAPFDAPGYNGARIDLVITYRVSEIDPYALRA